MKHCLYTLRLVSKALHVTPGTHENLHSFNVCKALSGALTSIAGLMYMLSQWTAFILHGLSDILHGASVAT